MPGLVDSAKPSIIMWTARVWEAGTASSNSRVTVYSVAPTSAHVAARVAKSVAIAIERMKPRVRRSARKAKWNAAPSASTPKSRMNHIGRPPFRMSVAMPLMTPGWARCDKIFSLSHVPRSGVLEGVDAADDSGERALVDGLRRGEVGTFDRVYAAYHGRVFAFLLRLAGRRDTAEDLAQETWLKLAKAAPTLREDTRLAPLLFTVARNAFLSHRRWAMLDLSRLVTVGFESIAAAADGPSPDEAHERARAVATLERALAALPVASREVLLLVGVEGLEQEEVARIVGVSYDALRQRLSRARAQLADRIEALEKETARRAGRAKSGGVA